MGAQIRTSFPVFNGFAPAEGPKALPITFDFSSEAAHDVNLLLENTEGVIQYVQSAFVDNGPNTNELVMRFAGTGQIVRIPAGAQMQVPIISTDQTRFTASTTPAANLNVLVILMNVPMPISEWGPQTTNINSALITGTYTDFSGTITVGGTSQAAIAANANRKGYIISNPPNQIEPLYINFTGAAQVGVDSIQLLPGETFNSNSLVLSLEAINVIAATTGHPFIAKELA